MKIQVEEYVREDGSCPYRSWFEGLDAAAAVKVAVAQFRLESGNTSSVKWLGGIGEYRIDSGPGYRIYLARDGAALMLLYAGGTKRTQKRDIERARTLHAEYRARKRRQDARPLRKGGEHGP